MTPEKEKPKTAEQLLIEQLSELSDRLDWITAEKLRYQNARDRAQREWEAVRQTYANVEEAHRVLQGRNVVKSRDGYPRQEVSWGASDTRRPFTPPPLQPGDLTHFWVYDGATGETIVPPTPLDPDAAPTVRMSLHTTGDGDAPKLLVHRHAGEDTWTACGQAAAAVGHATDDWSAVTCRSCLKVAPEGVPTGAQNVAQAPAEAPPQGAQPGTGTPEPHPTERDGAPSSPKEPRETESALPERVVDCAGDVWIRGDVFYPDDDEPRLAEAYWLEDQEAAPGLKLEWIVERWGVAERGNA